MNAEPGQLTTSQIDAKIADTAAQLQYLFKRRADAERHGVTPSPYITAGVEECTRTIDHLKSIRDVAPEVTA